MSIFDSLAEKAVSTVGDKSPAWVEREAKRIRSELPKGDDPESKALRETGEYAVAKLEKNKELVGRLGEAGAAGFMGLLSMGKKLEATRFAGDRLRYLREQAGWAELDAEVDQAAARTLGVKKDADAAEALAKDIGATAAKTLFPFLVSMAVAAL